jgi:hypothetical protein
VRLPLAGIVIAPEVFETPAELTARRGVARTSAPEPLIQPEPIIRPEPVERPERADPPNPLPAGLVPWQPAAAAKPPAFSPLQLQQDNRSEPFRWPYGRRLLLPSISSVKLPEKASAPLSLPAPTSLQLRGVQLAGRRQRPEVRELSKAPVFAPDPGLRVPSFAVGSSPLTALKLSVAPGETPSILALRARSRADINNLDLAVQPPAMPAPVERLALSQALPRLAPAVQNPRKQRRAAGVADPQRFRAATHIQVREPELQDSIPGNLPVFTTSLPWSGLRMISEIRPGLTLVPLRPPLQVPSLV